MIIILYGSQQSYPAEWKRKAFFKFVTVFHDQSWSQELKAKVGWKGCTISYVIIFQGKKACDCL